MFKYTEVKKERGGEKNFTWRSERVSLESLNYKEEGEVGDVTAQFATPGSHAPFTAAHCYKLVHEVSPGLRLLIITKSPL